MIRETQTTPPQPSGAVRIAERLAELADQADLAGFRELALSITALGIEAAEEARYAGKLFH